MTTLMSRHPHPLAAAIAFALSGSSGAATIAVDGSDCTLADAITAANTDKATGGCLKGVGADTLKLTARSYTLSQVNNDSAGPNGLPVVSSVVTINGDPDGHGKSAVIQRSSATGTPDFRLFHVAASGDLRLKRVSLINGRTGDTNPGGGIYNQGSVRLTDSTLSGNSAYRGGGLWNYGSAAVTNSTISSNHSTKSGGGIRNNKDKILTVTNSVLSGNSGTIGGGIFNNQGHVTVIRSVLSGNSATYDGGGLSSDSGSATLINSTISGNHATQNGGGVHSSYGWKYAFETLTLTDSTVSGNSAGAGGGGLFNEGATTVTLMNSTVSDNTAVQFGGGLFNKGAGAFYPGYVRLVNSRGEDCTNGPGGSIGFAGVNLIEDGSCQIADHGGIQGNPKLGPLLDNGGPTPTRALLAGSPAVNKADDALCQQADQRGAKRPESIACDIGAFERIVTAAPEIEPVISFFNQAVKDGQLTGIGNTPGQKRDRLEAASNQVLLAGDLNTRGLTARACQQLTATLSRIDTDDAPDKNDYVTGSAGPELFTMVKGLRAPLGCK